MQSGQERCALPLDAAGIVIEEFKHRAAMAQKEMLAYDPPAMFHTPRAVIVVIIAFWLVTGCGRAKFRDTAGAKMYLRAHGQELQSAADDWLHQESADTFCRFADDDYRWNEVFIRRQSNGDFSVETGSVDTWQVQSLRAALDSGHIDPAEFRRWDTNMRALDAYCIESFRISQKEKITDKYVVITLQGLSRWSWSSYGFAYAPVQSRAWEEIAWAARSKDHEYGPKTWVYELGDGWFYYVDLAR